eukprot:gene5753-biopygen813
MPAKDRRPPQPGPLATVRIRFAPKAAFGFGDLVRAKARDVPIPKFRVLTSSALGAKIIVMDAAGMEYDTLIGNVIG